MTQAISCYPSVNAKLLSRAIQKCKSSAYESSYSVEYWEAARKLLKEKIEKDFSVLPSFFDESEGDLAIEGDISVFVDLENDLVRFDDADKLTACIVNAINAYGDFFFESLQYFKDSHGLDDGEVDQSMTIGNFLWRLHQMEDTYCSRYQVFRIDIFDQLEYQSQWFGNTNYDVEELEDFLNPVD